MAHYLDQLLPFPPNLDIIKLFPDNINTIIKECAENQISLYQWESLSYLLFKEKRLQEFYQLTKYISEYVIPQKRFDDDSYKKVKIRIYNAISLYFLIPATKQENYEKSQEYFDNVVKNFNLSDKYDFDAFTFSLKAIYSFYRGEMEQTLNYCKTSQDNEANLINPLIGIAQVHFCKGNFEEALALFKKALKLKPDLPACVRLGMASCFFLLKKFTLAEFTYKRILQIDSKNVNAMLGLAVLSQMKKDYSSYFYWIEKSFIQDQSNPVTLYYLAEHYLFKKDYERSEKCVRKALSTIYTISRFQFKDKGKEEPFRNDYNELKSRLLYLIGFIRQIQGDLDQAFKYINQSKSFNRNNVLAAYSLSQVYLHSQHTNYPESNKMLEKIKQNYQGQIAFNIEIIKVLEFKYFIFKPLAYVSSKMLKNKKQVLEAYQAAVKYNNNDSEIHLEYGQQLEGLEAALQYQQAEKLLVENNKPLYPELYINMGVNFLIAGKLTEAEDCFLKCRKMIKDFDLPTEESEQVSEAQNQNSDELKLKKNMYQVTLLFNEGILMEEKFDYPGVFFQYLTFHKAIKIYQQAIAQNPYFFDSYVRLAHLQYKLGYSQEAIQLLEEAKVQFDKLVSQTKNINFSRSNQYNPIPAMHGYIAHKCLDDMTAKDQFKLAQEDCYSKLYLMAHDYQTAGDRSKVIDQATLKQTLRLVGTLAQKILQQDPNNMQAALFLILVIAETGKLKEAVPLLEKLQDYSSINPKILSNLAIVETALGTEENYQSAKLHFKRYFERTNYMPDEHTELSQAILNLSQKKYNEATTVIKKQILNNPGSVKHRLNLNFIYHHQCYEIINNQKSNQNLRIIDKSIVQFLKLMRLYEYLSKTTPYQNRELQYAIHVRSQIRPTQLNYKEKSEDRFTFIAGYKNSGAFDKLRREAEENEKIQRTKQEERERERKEQMQRFVSTSQPVENNQQEIQMEEEQIEEFRRIQEEFAREWKENQEKQKEEAERKKGGKRKKAENEEQSLEIVNSSEESDHTSEENIIPQDNNSEQNIVQIKQEQKQERQIEKQVKQNKKLKQVREQGVYLDQESDQENPEVQNDSQSQNSSIKQKKGKKQIQKKRRLIRQQDDEEEEFFNPHKEEFKDVKQEYQQDVQPQRKRSDEFSSDSNQNQKIKKELIKREVVDDEYDIF